MSHGGALATGGEWGIFAGMSTLAEIEAAIAQLPPEQWLEIRRWLDSHAPKAVAGSGAGKPEDFERWLEASTGIAKGRFTTDERMRETRGED